MKKIILALLTIVIFTIACNNSSKSTGTDSTSATSVAKEDAPVIHFANVNYDFGTINAGDKVSYDFKFTNTGKTPLIITDASATCGCTIPEYPKEPVAPGGNGIIKVVFNSAGKVGKQYKVVTITSNADPSTSEVYVTGEVKETVKTDIKTK